MKGLGSDPRGRRTPRRASVWATLVVLLVAIASVSATRPAPAAAEDNTWQVAIQEIAVFPDDGYLRDLRINNRGHVILTREREGSVTAFFWSPATGLIPIEIPGTPITVDAVALNDHDEVVVNSWSPHRAWRWDPDHGARELGDVSTDSRAQAINDAGQIAGSDVSTGSYTATRWDPDGSAEHFALGDDASAFSIAPDGTVAGDAGFTENYLRRLEFFVAPVGGPAQVVGKQSGPFVAGPFVDDHGHFAFGGILNSFAEWSPAGMGSAWSDTESAYLGGMSSSGSVIGLKYEQVAGAFHYHGFVWNPITRVTRYLPVEPGFESFSAAIDRRGDVAGPRDPVGPDVVGGPPHVKAGRFWTPDGLAVDLGELTNPWSMNDHFQVLGDGGRSRVLLATLTPPNDESLQVSATSTTVPTTPTTAPSAIGSKDPDAGPAVAVSATPALTG